MASNRIFLCNHSWHSYLEVFTIGFLTCDYLVSFILAMNNLKNMKGKPKGRHFFPKGKKKECENKEIQELSMKYSQVSSSDINSFDDIPLSARTLKGLKEHNYCIPTEIQKEAVIFALRGKDVLGAAKTGSGKTLAFLIPVLEKLYCEKWSNLDGVGAIIITPTRELALQIYETLLKVGKYHEFSAGLIIGGKDLAFEKNRMHQVNILICTPGRLLQHMDENPLFSCLNMQILVLDEADRCLDLGFEKSMNAIIENLPQTRQTLLFSATQTKNVKDLARLSLVDPEYISVHENEKFKTPDGLTQSYIICEHHEKIAILWSFIKAHPRQKIIVFLATCNQVRYITEIFRKLRPKNPLFALQGKIHQLKRMDVYHAFCRKEHAVLFATDIAARGLDFPNVDWVVQGDCPEDIDAYIHRVGRTARYTRAGESLLIISPSQSAIIEKLQDSRIPINEIKINPEQIMNPQAKLELFVAKSTEMKACAQRAFVSYFKSIFLMKDKSVFDVKSIDAYQYARSMGMIAAPKVRFIQRMEKKKVENGQNDISKRDYSKIEIIEEIKSGPNGKKDFNFIEDDASDDDGFTFSIKRKNHDLEHLKNDLIIESELSNAEDLCSKQKPVVTKAKIAKKILKRKVQPNKKIVFDDEGEAVINQMTERVTDAGRNFETADDFGISVAEAQKTLQEEDKYDRKIYAQLSKTRKKEKKLKEKGKKKEEDEEKDEFGDDFESESEGGSEPDLSWLPDPDNVYKEEDAKNDSESEKMPTNKRKLPSDFDSDSEDDLGLSLGDKEDLALKLISFKN